MGDERDTDDLFDERQLVEQARVDVEAFAALYRRYVDPVYRFALRRTGDVALAEDITATTFERALARLDQFRWKSGGFAPWIFRIATNELTDHYRRQGRRRGDRARRAADRMHDTVAFDDLDRIDSNDTAIALRSALDSLNLRYQRVLTLRYLSGLEHEQAAAAMGVTPSLMAVLVHRASASLRSAMERSATEPRQDTR